MDADAADADAAAADADAADAADADAADADAAAADADAAGPDASYAHVSFAHAWDLLVVASMSGELIEVNPAWTRVLGWRRDELLGSRYLEWVHPDDRAATRARLRALEHGAAVTGLENRYRTAEGGYRWLQWNVVADVAADLVRGVARDVTDQRREAALLGHVEQLSRIGSWEAELGTDEVWWSTVTHELHGTDAADGPFTVSQALAFYPPESSRRIKRCFEELVATGRGYDIEVPLQTADGRAIWVRTTGRARRRDDAGSVTGVYGTIADITEERQRRLTLLRFKEFVELAHDGIWELDHRRRTTYANHRMAELLERPVAELSGVDASALIVEEDRGRFLRALAADDTSQPLELELRLELTDATTRWVQLAIRPRRDGHGALTSHLAVVADVSALKASEERSRRSEAQLRAFFDLAPTPIVVTGWPDGELLDGNLAAAALLGGHIEQLKGQHHHALLADLSPARLAQVREQLSRSDSYGPIERSIEDLDGMVHDVVLEGVLLPTAAGQPAVWTIVDDVTERRRVERLKQEFVATVSHELRTPLTSITGALELLARGVTGTADLRDDQAAELVGIAGRNSKRLAALVDDLLDLSRIEADAAKPDLHEHDLGVLVAECVSEYRASATRGGVELVSSQFEPTPVRADARRLHQAVGNLLANAISFAPPGSNVEVDVCRTGTHAQLRVRDHGPGVPASFEPHLFEPFTQADASDQRARGGSGLGLSIVARVAGQHGGEVVHQRPDEGGACFLVQLPLAGEVTAVGGVATD